MAAPRKARSLTKSLSNDNYHLTLQKKFQMDTSEKSSRSKRKIIIQDDIKTDKKCYSATIKQIYNLSYPDNVEYFNLKVCIKNFQQKRNCIKLVLNDYTGDIPAILWTPYSIHDWKKYRYVIYIYIQYHTFILYINI